MREPPGRRPPGRPPAGPPGGAPRAPSPTYPPPIPRASADAWERHQDAQPQNPGLIFTRFAPDWGTAHRPRHGEPTVKQRGLEAVVGAGRRGDERLLAAWNQRWEAGAREIGAEPFVLATEWRLIAGLGQSGPLDVGFTFHRYGFPMLPASSVKGLARAAGRLAVATRLDTADLTGVDDALGTPEDADFRRRLGAFGATAEAAGTLAAAFRAVFGTTAAAGHAVFLDAIPRAIPGRLPRLELDIMNPHYPDYYGDTVNQVPPTDAQNPRPVYFLAVAAGTEFNFAVGWRDPLDEASRALRDQARAWLREGLTELGAGAKTGAGYGYFTAPQAELPANGGRPREARPARQAASGHASTPSAAPTARPTPPAAPTAAPPPAPPPLPTATRYGVIRDIDSAKTKRGHVEDEETHVVYRFSTAVIRGNFPARRERVRFELQGDEVVLVRRL